MKRNACLLPLMVLCLCSCADSASSSSSSGVSESSSSSSSQVAAKTLYFPPSSYDGVGVDVFLDMDPVKLTYIYVGEGVEEPIERFEYNEDYISIDGEGRVTGKQAGSTRVYAYTATQKVEVRINVKTRISYRCLSSLLEMQTLYQEHGSPKGAALFCGDSFFDTRYNWTTFYSDFSDYNVFCSGIGTTRTEDWMYMKKELIADFAPSQVFLHLGTNNLNDAGDTGKTCAAKVINLLEEIHLSVPEADIYYFGIERTTNPAFALSHNKSLESNAEVKEHCESTSYLHYLDSPSLFEEDIDNYLISDGLHPSAAGYALYVDMVKDLLIRK
ncbi:MAG: hypothetical protein IAC61_01870 [Firmicutes bacterium]|uniref:SGNH hydrolase-type esterase domain-containing protein n=1 Tax=Candidatus Alloenteromonas pullistercoris TaxID=2840785 RepID=A0A9D9GSY2_9FIRM|nr:hypothetical protein [Candidatus Enteromonas pullistercoris]